MGRRGPPSLPAELHERRGTLRADRHGSGTFTIGGKTLEAPAAPAHLSDPERRTWDDLVPVLHGAGILDLVDELALEGLVIVVARARAADELLRQEDTHLVVRGDRGHVQNPLVKISRDAWAEARAWFGKFGMTASDRVSLGVGGLEGLTLRVALERALSGVPEKDAPEQLLLEAGDLCESTRRRDGAPCLRELEHAGRHRYE